VCVPTAVSAWRSRRHGPLGLARVARDRLAHRLWLDESHVWYLLDLARLQRLPLRRGYELRSGTLDDRPALAQHPETTPTENAKRRLERGAQLWLVTIGDQIAFACWIFFDTTPAIAARGGELRLPAGTACLEDSFTTPDHRGRGIAGAAWTAIAEHLADDAYEMLITKVAVENTPSRRAVEKAGFRPAGEMRLHRRGFRTRVSVSSTAAELTGPEARTEAELERGLRR
jgi:RimJ/RimL family protein N-acetyltransferase